MFLSLKNYRDGGNGSAIIRVVVFAGGPLNLTYSVNSGGGADSGGNGRLDSVDTPVSFIKNGYSFHETNLYIHNLNRYPGSHFLSVESNKGSGSIRFTGPGEELSVDYPLDESTLPGYQPPIITPPVTPGPETPGPTVPSDPDFIASLVEIRQMVLDCFNVFNETSYTSFKLIPSNHNHSFKIGDAINLVINKYSDTRTNGTNGSKLQRAVMIHSLRTSGVLPQIQHEILHPTIFSGE